MNNGANLSPQRHWLASLSALMVAGAMILSAYAAHAPVTPASQHQLDIAAAMLFGQGLASVLLARQVRSPQIIWALLLGTGLFVGSVVGHALAGWSSRLAPIGGMLMIMSWLVLAIHLRPPRTRAPH